MFSSLLSMHWSQRFGNFSTIVYLISAFVDLVRLSMVNDATRFTILFRARNQSKRFAVSSNALPRYMLSIVITLFRDISQYWRKSSSTCSRHRYFSCLSSFFLLQFGNKTYLGVLYWVDRESLVHALFCLKAWAIKAICTCFWGPEAQLSFPWLSASQFKMESWSLASLKAF